MTKTERERAQKHLYKQKGSENWFFRLYLNGKQVRETTGTADETEACRIALVRLDEAGADRAQIKKFTGPEQKKITVQQLLDGLKLNYETRGKGGPRLLSNLRPLEEWFGHFKAVELRGVDLDRFIKHAQEHGRCKDSSKPARPASINRCLQLLSQSYKLAKADELLNHEPPKRRLSEVGNTRLGFFATIGLLPRTVASARLPEGASHCSATCAAGERARLRVSSGQILTGFHQASRAGAQ